MKILMKCLECKLVDKRKFTSMLVTNTGLTVEVETDCAIAPGTWYSLLLKGLWVGPNTNPGDCVGDVEGFKVGNYSLKGVNFQEEAKLKEIL